MFALEKFVNLERSKLNNKSFSQNSRDKSTSKAIQVYWVLVYGVSLR